MRKLLIVLAVMALLPVTQVSADPLVLGGTSNSVSYSLYGYNHWNIGGGSFDVSKLNGTDLPWVYCVDLYHYINLNGSYPNTLVRDDGVVNGSVVNNADAVAWLLDTYAAGAAGNSAKEAGLQLLIWKAIYGANFSALSSNSWYTVWSGTPFGTGDVSNYRWLTPDSRCLGDSNDAPDCKQGLVTYQPVPDAGSTVVLLGAALAGLAAWRRKRQ